MRNKKNLIAWKLLSEITKTKETFCRNVKKGLTEKKSKISARIKVKQQTNCNKK